MCGFDSRWALWFRTTRPCGAAWSARHSVKVEAAGSNPARGAAIAFGRAVGRRTACKAAALTGDVGSIPTRGTGSRGDKHKGDRRKTRPVRLVVQDGGFSTRKRGFDSPTGHWGSAPHGDVDQPGRSRHAQNVDSVGSNPTVTTGSTLQTGRRSTGSHKPGGWVQLPGLQLSTSCCNW